MKGEDRALIIGAAASVLGYVGTYLSGQPAYAVIGGVVFAVGAGLKAYLKS